MIHLARGVSNPSSLTDGEAQERQVVDRHGEGFAGEVGAADREPGNVQAPATEEKEFAFHTSEGPKHDAADEQHVQDLTKLERQDREVHPRQSRADGAQDRGNQRRRNDTGTEIELKRAHIQEDVREPARVRPEAEIGSLAERQQPRGPEQQVEGEASDRECECVTQDDYVVGIRMRGGVRSMTALAPTSIRLSDRPDIREPRCSVSATRKSRTALASASPR